MSGFATGGNSIDDLLADALAGKYYDPSYHHHRSITYSKVDETRDTIEHLSKRPEGMPNPQTVPESEAKNKRRKRNR
ncbi:MAG: hypothetical protein AAF585_00670 [Verrucomicrobiota bacterium]